MSDTPTNNQAPTQEAQSQENQQPQENQQSQQPQEKKQVRYFEIDGERVSEEEIRRNYKKFKGADTKFREAHQIKQATASFYEALVNDPESVLSDPRLNIPKDKRRAMAEKILMEELQSELEQLDPRDQRVKELETKLNQYQQKEEEELTQKQQQEYARVVDQRREAIAKTLNEAIKLSPLAKDQETQGEVIKEMATYMRLCREMGENPSPEEIAKHVEGRFMRSFGTLASRLTGEDLVSFLGENVIKEIRKYDLERLRKSREVQPPAQEQSWESSTPRKQEFISPHELVKRNRR